MSVITTNIRKPDAAPEPVPPHVAATSPISLTQVAADKVREIRTDEAIEEAFSDDGELEQPTCSKCYDHGCYFCR